MFRENYAIKKEWIEYAFKKFDLDRFFKYKLISADAGRRKPDKRVFQMFLKSIGGTPEKCIFIDDKDDNLKVASALGIDTIRFFPKNFLLKQHS